MTVTKEAIEAANVPVRERIERLVRDVKAGAIIGYDGPQEYWSTRMGAEASIETARLLETALSTPVEGKVKPLEWLPISFGDEVANTILGTYTITGGETFFVWFAGQADDEDYSVAAPSMDAAKSFAQTDYETRILSALISSPCKDGGQEVEAEPVGYGYAPEMQSGKGGFWVSWEESNSYDTPVYCRPQPASKVPADLWDGPIEELSRAKAGRFYDVAKEHPNCALGEREAYVNKNWQNWREDAAIEVASLSQPASTALVERLEPIGYIGQSSADMLRSGEIPGAALSREATKSSTVPVFTECVKQVEAETWAALCKLTFAVQHNPNCPSPFLVRMPGSSGAIDMKPYGDAIGLVRHQTGDILGFGKTFTEAARSALSSSRSTSPWRRKP